LKKQGGRRRRPRNRQICVPWIHKQDKSKTSKRKKSQGKRTVKKGTFGKKVKKSSQLTVTFMGPAHGIQKRKTNKGWEDKELRGEKKDWKKSARAVTYIGFSRKPEIKVSKERGASRPLRGGGGE